jgi:hypothetical protein
MSEQALTADDLSQLRCQARLDMTAIAGSPCQLNASRLDRLLDEHHRLRTLLETLLHWNDQGHVDKSWWEAAREELAR